MVVRDEEILTPREAHPVREGDYVYLLAPPEKAQALDRFFVDMPPPRAPEPELLGDFFVPGTATLGALAEIYGLQVAAEQNEVPLADYFAQVLGRPPKTGDVVSLGPIALLAHKVDFGRVTTVGLRLAEPETPADLAGQLKALWQAGRGNCSVSGLIRENSGTRSSVAIRRANISGRASAGPCCTSQAPPNSTAGPEQVADTRSFPGTAAPRRSTALRPCQVSGYMPLKAQTAKLVRDEEDQRAGHHGRHHGQRAAPAPRIDAGQRRHRDRRVDHERHPPVVAREGRSR